MDFNKIIPMPDTVFRGNLGSNERALYGNNNWYDWSVANWHTKWNAYGFEDLEEHEVDDQLRFETAWTAPHPILKKLSEMAPDLEITHRWADEDFGMNCGERGYKNGEITGEFQPEGGSVEAYDFSAEVMECEVSDYGLRMNSDGSSYEVVRACNYLKLLRYSYSSGGKSFASQPFDIRKLFYLIWQTHARLSNVVIENQDFEKLIKHYDRENTVFYLDPPYYQTEGMYAQAFTKEDHYRLFETLKNVKGKWLLSYNDCEFIRDLYRDYFIFEFSRVHSMAQRYEAGKQFPELLIGNYDLYERERSKPYQMTLFGHEEFDYEKILKECILQCKIRL